MVKRTGTSSKVQILKLVEGGVGRMTNLTTFSQLQWVKGKSLINDLIDSGYCEFFDGRVVLTDKGRRFLSFVDEFFDFFEKDLNNFFRYG